jgi:signal transduction histidine kinase
MRTSLVEKIGEGRAQSGVSKHVEVKIEDTGKGMDETEIAGLFKPFNSKKPGGSGLGLVIAKRIVEEHGGTIEVQSKVNVGTVVRIELPAG